MRVIGVAPGGAGLGCWPEVIADVYSVNHMVEQNWQEYLSLQNLTAKCFFHGSLSFASQVTAFFALRLNNGQEIYLCNTGGLAQQSKKIGHKVLVFKKSDFRVVIARPQIPQHHWQYRHL